jgi:hypothetical protein
MNRVLGLLLGIVILAAAGCSGAPSTGGLTGSREISTGRPILVDDVSDAVDTKGRLIAGSGQAVVAAIRESLRTHNIGMTTKSDRNAYKLKSKIIHWEDHATEWNGVPDSIAISFELIDLADGELVSISSGKTQSSTLEIGQYAPARLVPDAVSKGMKPLFGWKK